MSALLICVASSRSQRLLQEGHQCGEFHQITQPAYHKEARHPPRQATAMAWLLAHSRDEHDDLRCPRYHGACNGTAKNAQDGLH